MDWVIRTRASRPWSARFLACLSSLLLFASPPLAASAAPQGRGDDSDAYFERGPVHELRLVVSREAEAALRESPRSYAPVVVEIDGKARLSGGGVKLKGAAGSYQEWDERPALTIKLDKFDGVDLFHGLEKFHLNNSVQDESLLSEWLASELFRECGLPATRVAHARVKLNDRDMGVYVLKEGFDKRFLRRWFKDDEGNLYDGGFCMDVDEDLELDSGPGGEERADLDALARAATEADLQVRWKSLPELLDIERFTRHVALEAMVGHWDGYAWNRNNYRLYFEPGGKAVFLPHGMDQCFQDPGASVLDMPVAHVAKSVMKNPAWRAEYRREIAKLLPKFEAKRLGKKLDEVQRRLEPALKKVSAEAAELQALRAVELRERLVERERSLKEQKSQPEPKPQVFKPGVAVQVKGWRPMSEVEDAVVEPRKLGATQFLSIACGPSKRCVAGWRSGVLLSRGRYKLSAQVQLDGVEALVEDGAPGSGAVARISGASSARVEAGDGTKSLEFEFEVLEETGDVELVLELRARAGKALFRQDSLRLVRLADAR
jgi:hypothetical protein